MAKRKSTIAKAIFNLVLGIPTFMSLTKRIGSLVRYEARVAGKSIINIIILALLCVVLLTTSWLCLLGMLVVYLLSLQWAMAFILLTVLGINIFALLIICLLLIKHKKRLLFPETRYLIEETRRVYEES